MSEVFEKIGGADRDRTGGLLVANVESTHRYLVHSVSFKHVLETQKCRFIGTVMEQVFGQRFRSLR